MPGFLYTDDLLLCSKSEEDLKAMAGHFADMCMSRGLKFNAGKRKLMVLGGDKGLECEARLD